MFAFQSTLRQGADIFAQAQRQLPYATALALNRTAQAVQEVIVQEMARAFDRPTPYTLRALRVVRATKDQLSATVDFKDAAGKGISANRYLGPQVFGGGRSLKRSERALAKSGLPTGAFTVPAAGAELDAYGNMSRGQTIRLLSYLQAFGERGYRANATERSRAKAAKVGKSKEGYRRINGVMYFISRGKGQVSGNRTQHLPAGVWQKTGTHGADVKPVMLAVSDVRYEPRLPFYETADQIFGERFDAEFSSAFDVAMASAR